MRALLFWLIISCSCGITWADGSGRFVGKVVVEWLDDDPFVPRMRLLEDFAFADLRGKTWIAEKGSLLDGRSVPLTFRDAFGLPFEGQYRKTSVLYDHYCQAMSEPWRDVHRMFYAASLAEGVDAIDAKLMYMALYAGGLRWEMKGSSCFRGCHASAPTLTWKPAIGDLDLKPVADWIRQASPDLDAIDHHLDGIIRRPGPHIFVQGR